jgi:hypothetical protein
LTFQSPVKINKEDVTNGRTAINIPGADFSSPKSQKSPTSLPAVEKRSSIRLEPSSQSPQHTTRDQNGAKVSNHHNNHNNNINKTNNACLNNLILPLLSEVRLFLSQKKIILFVILFLHVIMNE